MSKKLNRSEIEAIAKRILEEVNEVNIKYNEAKKLDPVYLAEIEKINVKNPLVLLKQELSKAIKISMGTNWEDDIQLHLGANSQKYKDLESSIKKEKEEYIKSQMKVIYSIPRNSWDKENNKVYRTLVDDITISQITISDIQLLINTLKAKLI